MSELQNGRRTYYEKVDNELVKEICDIASEDDKSQFVDLMKAVYPRQDPSELRYCPPRVFDYICNWGAVHCATAMLDGEAGLTVDLNLPNQTGAYPLHYACSCLSYDMIDFLLRHGARTDVRTLGSALLRGDLLPLNVTLENLSFHKYLVEWTSKESIFKLIIILCLPAMKLPLETSRLLARNTKEVDKEFVHYVMEGRIIEMAALLLVAREKVMPPGMFEGNYCLGSDGSMTIRQRILEEIALLIDEETRLMGNSNKCKSVRMVKEKKTSMMTALALLEVFERVGDAIEKYRLSVQSPMTKEKVVEDIKILLEEAEFTLKEKDIELNDIDCENIKLATEVLEERTLFMSQSHDFFSQNRITNKESEQNWSITRLFPRSALSPDVRPFHTLPSIKNKAVDKFRGCVSNSDRNLTAMKRSAASFLSKKRFASFALAIKNGITRIG